MKIDLITLDEKCSICGENKIADIIRKKKWCPRCQMMGLNERLGAIEDYP